MTKKNKQILQLLFAAGLVACAFVVLGCDDDDSDGSGVSGRLILIVHGSEDIESAVPKALWPEDMVEAIEARVGIDSGWEIRAYHWEEDSKDLMTAASQAIIHGTGLGKELAGESYEVIHLIGHSVGSFLIHALTESYLAAASNPATIQATYLDPFCMDPDFDVTWGNKNFGAGADFSDMYLNSDDIVPSTHDPLDNAHNFDITAHPERDTTGIEPDWWPSDYEENRATHWWPISYYIMTIDDPTIEDGFQLAPIVTGTDDMTGFGTYPKGETTDVP